MTMTDLRHPGGGRQSAPTDGPKAGPGTILRSAPTVVLAGLSLGAYAVSLASVTSLQSEADAATTELRAPAVEALAALAAGHDSIEERLGAARLKLAGSGDAYGEAAAALEALQARVDALAAGVASLEVGSLALPTRITLPSAPRVPAAVPRPATQATTGASGG
jgi:hypothetical protein